MEKEKQRHRLFGKIQRTPLWKKEEFSEIEYEPKPVKELLTEMKDISELVIDLAYSAVLFQNEEIAEEVKYLEVRMDTLNYDIRIMAMMAARSKEDAEQLAGILQIAQAAEKISNTAGDIILLMKEKTEPLLPRILAKADEQIFRLKVTKDCIGCNQNIGELNIEAETGMRIIAIRRKSYWIYNPQSSCHLEAEDIIISRGNDDGYKQLNAFFLGKKEDIQ